MKISTFEVIHFVFEAKMDPPMTPKEYIYGYGQIREELTDESIINTPVPRATSTVDRKQLNLECDGSPISTLEEIKGNQKSKSLKTNEKLPSAADQLQVLTKKMNFLRFNKLGQENKYKFGIPLDRPSLSGSDVGSAISSLGLLDVDSLEDFPDETKLIYKMLERSSSSETSSNSQPVSEKSFNLNHQASSITSCSKELECSYLVADLRLRKEKALAMLAIKRAEEREQHPSALPSYLLRPEDESAKLSYSQAPIPHSVREEISLDNSNLLSNNESERNPFATTFGAEEQRNDSFFDAEEFIAGESSQAAALLFADQEECIKKANEIPPLTSQSTVNDISQMVVDNCEDVILGSTFLGNGYHGEPAKLPIDEFFRMRTEKIGCLGTKDKKQRPSFGREITSPVKSLKSDHCNQRSLSSDSDSNSDDEAIHRISTKKRTKNKDDIKPPTNLPELFASSGSLMSVNRIADVLNNEENKASLSVGQIDKQSSAMNYSLGIDRILKDTSNLPKHNIVYKVDELTREKIPDVCQIDSGKQSDVNLNLSAYDGDSSLLSLDDNIPEPSKRLLIPTGTKYHGKVCKPNLSEGLISSERTVPSDKSVCSGKQNEVNRLNEKSNCIPSDLAAKSVSAYPNITVSELKDTPSIVSINHPTAVTNKKSENLLNNSITDESASIPNVSIFSDRLSDYHETNFDADSDVSNGWILMDDYAPTACDGTFDLTSETSIKDYEDLIYLRTETGEEKTLKFGLLPELSHQQLLITIVNRTQMELPISITIDHQGQYHAFSVSDGTSLNESQFSDNTERQPIYSCLKSGQQKKIHFLVTFHAPDSRQLGLAQSRKIIDLSAILLVSLDIPGQPKLKSLALQGSTGFTLLSFNKASTPLLTLKCAAGKTIDCPFQMKNDGVVPLSLTVDCDKLGTEMEEDVLTIEPKLLEILPGQEAATMIRFAPRGTEPRFIDVRLVISIEPNGSTFESDVLCVITVDRRNRDNSRSSSGSSSKGSTSIASKGSSENSVNTSLHIKSTHTELVWASMPLAKSDTKAFTVKNSSDSTCKVMATINENNHSYKFKNEQGDIVEQRKLVLSSSEGCKLNVMLKPTKVGAIVGNVSFNSFGSTSSSPTQTIKLYAYGGTGQLCVEGIPKDGMGKLWLSIGELNSLRSPMQARFRLHNTGNLPIFARIKFFAKGVREFSDATLTVEPAQVVIQPGNYVPVRVVYQPQASDNSWFVRDVTELAILQILTGDEPTRLRLRRILKKYQGAGRALNEVYRFNVFDLCGKFPGEEKIDDVQFLRDPESAGKLLCHSLIVQEVSLIIEKPHSVSLLNAQSVSGFDDSTHLFQTLCGETDITTATRYDATLNESRLSWSVWPTEICLTPPAVATRNICVRNNSNREQTFEVEVSVDNVVVRPSQGIIPANGEVTLAVYCTTLPIANQSVAKVKILMENDMQEVEVMLKRGKPVVPSYSQPRHPSAPESVFSGSTVHCQMPSTMTSSTPISITNHPSRILHPNNSNRTMAYNPSALSSDSRASGSFIARGSDSVSRNSLKANFDIDADVTDVQKKTVDINYRHSGGEDDGQIMKNTIFRSSNGIDVCVGKNDKVSDQDAESVEVYPKSSSSMPGSLTDPVLHQKWKKERKILEQNDATITTGSSEEKYFKTVSGLMDSAYTDASRVNGDSCLSTHQLSKSGSKQVSLEAPGLYLNANSNNKTLGIQTSLSKTEAAIGDKDYVSYIPSRLGPQQSDGALIGVFSDNYDITFPETSVGRISSYKITLKNTSNQTCQVNMSNVEPPFYCAAKHYEIKGKWYLRFKVYFNPTSSGDYKQNVLLEPVGGIPLGFLFSGTGVVNEPIPFSAENLH